MLRKRVAAWTMWVRLAGVIGIVVALVAGGIAVYRGGREPSPDPEPPPVAVLVRGVHGFAAPRGVAVSGEVEAERSASVAFQVAGRVAHVTAEEGDAVARGQLLAELDPVEYRLAVELAATQTELAENEFRRAEQLIEQRSMTPADFDRARAAVRRARAEEELARKRLADTRLVAPLGGVLAMRAVNPGEQAAPGEPVFTIVAMDPVQVRAGVPEAEIGRVRVGQQATVAVPSLGGASFEGRVRLIGVIADPVSRTYPVRIAVANPDGLLRPGMIAEAAVHEDALIRALTVPGEAVVREPDGRTVVYVYHAGEERVYARRVTIGTVYGREVEVVDGLEADDLVVVGGQHRVQDGSRVNARILPPPGTEDAA